MQLKLDDNNYVLGYAEIGGIDDGVDYTGPVPDDFQINCNYYYLSDGALVLDAAKQSAAAEANALQSELEGLYEWFGWYDNQVQQYDRSVRMGEPFDEDIEELDAQAKQKQLRIREIRQTLNISA